MKIAVLGGAGAMGALYGGRLAQAGQDVTLVDLWREAVDAINSQGMEIVEQSGALTRVPVRATTDPAAVGPVDLLIVLVKGQHTAQAMRSALPMVGPDTVVLSLQNGWGNVPRLAELVGEARVLAGVTIHSVTVLGPGRIQHAGQGMTYVGEVNGALTPRVYEVAEVLRAAGFDVTPTDQVLKVIWSKLALNCCALAMCALLKFRSGQLVEYEASSSLMQALLREVVAVANAQGIDLDFDERWTAITAQLRRAAGARASMLQDIENRRRTEIDTINGAVVALGRQYGIPTPHNETMLLLIKALEETL